MTTAEPTTEHSPEQTATPARVPVLAGRVVLRSQGVSWEGRAGDLLVVPDGRHTLFVEEPSAVPLTVVTA